MVGVVDGAEQQERTEVGCKAEGDTRSSGFHVASRQSFDQSAQGLRASDLVTFVSRLSYFVSYPIRSITTQPDKLLHLRFI